MEGADRKHYCTPRPFGFGRCSAAYYGRFMAAIDLIRDLNYGLDYFSPLAFASCRKDADSATLR